MIRELWSDQELKHAVYAYLYMLNLQECDISYEHKDIIRALKKKLPKRNDASIRYRMRNISFVLSEMHFPILSKYTPAQQVGKNIKKRISSIVDDYTSSFGYIAENKSRIFTSNSETVEELSEIQIFLKKLGKENNPWIGHNKPPEQELLEHNDDIRKILNDIEEIKNRIKSEENIKQTKSAFIQIGLKIFWWLGDRITDFSKAAAISAGTALGAYVSYAAISDKIISILKFLTNLVIN